MRLLTFLLFLAGVAIPWYLIGSGWATGLWVTGAVIVSIIVLFMYSAHLLFVNDTTGQVAATPRGAGLIDGQSYVLVADVRNGSHHIALVSHLRADGTIDDEVRAFYIDRLPRSPFTFNREDCALEPITLTTTATTTTTTT